MMGETAEIKKPETLRAGRYLVGNILGAGGFGITYQCLDRKKQIICAIKEYFPESIAARDAQSGYIVPFPKYRQAYIHGKQRFLEEAYVLQQLCRISGVVQVWDSFEENQTAYYVMEFLEGKTLKQLMNVMGGKIPYELGVEIITKAGEALELVHHEGGIFHRDISPQNIIILPDGIVKIIDFGSAKALSIKQEQQFSVVLKPGFAPPEQYFTNRQQGSFTDVYALAGTFYNAVSGKMVPNAPERLGGESYVALDKLVKQCSHEISAAVDKALLLEPRFRTQTVRELINSICMKTNIQEGRLQQKVGILEVLTGMNAGRRWPLSHGVEMKVGSSPKMSQIVIEGHPEISRIHFSVTFDSKKQCFYVVDYSLNGLYYQKVRLEKNKKYRVEAGQILAIGSDMCTLKMEVE